MRYLFHLFICYKYRCLLVFSFPHFLPCLLTSLFFFFCIPTLPCLLFCVSSASSVVMRSVSAVNLKQLTIMLHSVACPFQICLKLITASTIELNSFEKSMHPCLELCQQEPCCIFFVYFMTFINLSGCFLLDDHASVLQNCRFTVKNIRSRELKAGQSL